MASPSAVSPYCVPQDPRQIRAAFTTETSKGGKVHGVALVLASVKFPLVP